MNTNNLKRFAKEARIKLLDQVGHKLEFVLSHDTAELRGKQQEIDQLKKKIAEQGKEQVVETVAYTWFNRLMALRFMDANGYTIPKVVTPLPGMTNPEILQNTLAGNIEPELRLDRQRLNDLLDGKTAATDAHTEAYKMLLVASCNQWHTAMPFMFERISDYTELLLPDDLLSDYSIVVDIRNGMSDEDCQQEELIGWLYQFYIADKKDDVFEGLKKNIKITAENIPAATQLFTPRWIVRYMVENTLGKLWLTLKPNSKLRQFMPYYIEAPEGNAPAPLPEGIKGVTDITFLDPCQGSGHVLVYAFDLFTKIYEEEGYNTNEIPALILEHNLFGIDIDERAAQLAAFALTMKARSYYPRFLRKPVQPHVIALENVNEDIIKQAVKLPLAVAGKLVYDYRDLTLFNLTQADNFGSLIQIDPEELKALQIQKGSIWQEQEQKLKEQAEWLSRQYHCVVTNPPYMGIRGMNDELKMFVEKKFPNSKNDLFATFIERCLNLTFDLGYSSLINQHSWMFLSSFQILRSLILTSHKISSLIHLGPKTFPEIGGEVVQSVSFVLNKGNVQNDNSIFYRLVQFKQEGEKEKHFLSRSNHHVFNQRDFSKIPSSPFAYWIGNKTLELFGSENNIERYAKPRQGIATSDNNRFLKLWNEVSFSKIDFNKKHNEKSLQKWFPLSKGGGNVKWYGLSDYVINWENDGEEIKSYAAKLYGSYTRTIKNISFYFKKHIGWSALSSSGMSARLYPDGYIFGAGGNAAFPDEKYQNIILAFFNSNVFTYLLKIINPTFNLNAGEIAKLPIIESDEFKINELSAICINISQLYNSTQETSWNFLNNQIVNQKVNNISLAFKTLEKKWRDNFYELLKSEVKLNEIFISLYDLKDELKPDISLEEITILQEESKIIDGELFIDPIPVLLQLLSYAVGCMFGRYSLDKPSLVLANQGEILRDFLQQVPSPTFMPDEDNIIPVLEGEWFTDDIVGRSKVFLKAAFGEEHFEENLKYIEDTLGKDIRKYFVKDFYNDHIKRYKKRPIYWMFSSPRGHFKALIYMHRYQPDLCSKMLNDYLQAFISKLEAAKQTQTMLSLREDISAREKIVVVKEIEKYETMLKDCREYEKTLFTIATQKISIDLDVGVKVNYQKFKEVLVPIKGLEKEEE
jgi:type II restriction/modification system DNA methylase subunit YeeA